MCQVSSLKDTAEVRTALRSVRQRRMRMIGAGRVVAAMVELGAERRLCGYCDALLERKRHKP